MSVWTKIFGEPAEEPNWRLCGTIKGEYFSRLNPRHPDYDLTDSKKNETDHQLTYYLYEDQFGNRKFDVIDSDRGDLDLEEIKKDAYGKTGLVIPKDDILYRIKRYREKIRPWLDGRYDPDIPDYETIPKNDFQNRLAKKKIK